MSEWLSMSASAALGWAALITLWTVRLLCAVVLVLGLTALA